MVLSIFFTVYLIVARPPDKPVTTPLLSIEAIDGFNEDHTPLDDVSM